jgi:hypothetical protein
MFRKEILPPSALLASGILEISNLAYTSTLKVDAVKFLRTVGGLLPDGTALYPRRPTSNQSK